MRLLIGRLLTMSAEPLQITMGVFVYLFWKLKHWGMLMFCVQEEVTYQMDWERLL